MKSIFFLAGLFVVCFPVLGKSLCKPEDNMVFSCEIESKNVSVCLTPNKAIEYLYGNKDKVELRLSAPVFSSTSCPGGGISRLRFQNGNYSYIVYDVMCNESRVSDTQWSKSDFAGLIVLNQNRVIINNDCTDFEDGVFGVNSGILPETVEREDFNFELP